MKYGQQDYDFDEGWHTPLAKTIRQYEYFSYPVHEALFLPELYICHRAT
jgi:hypothetical protein